MKSRLALLLLILWPLSSRSQSFEDRLRQTEKVVFFDSVVVAKSALQQAVKLTPNAGRVRVDTLGASINENTYGDVRYLCVDSVLSKSVRVGDVWHEPEPLKGLENLKAANPFMMPDGQTIYFSQRTKDKLDVCITRYDSDNKVYLKPEILGFPFNSASNDYLFCIDEPSGVGFFATDRRQTDGFACVYYFLHEGPRDRWTSTNLDVLKSRAEIRSIVDTQEGREEDIRKAKENWSNALENK